MSGPVLLRPEEAAERLGVTSVTLGRYATDGVLTEVRQGTGMRRYVAHEIELLADVRHKDRVIADLQAQLLTAQRRSDALHRALEAFAASERTP